MMAGDAACDRCHWTNGAEEAFRHLDVHKAANARLPLEIAGHDDRRARRLCSRTQSPHASTRRLNSESGFHYLKRLHCNVTVRYGYSEHRRPSNCDASLVADGQGVRLTRPCRIEP